ncbi:AraC family transcriptional regulator [Streptosporangium roseum]|uniref:AraC family transcriptional regulator n=1 Tax=Streptosporangium roseum TaxID=2001 RepID=UPI0033247DE9
MRSVKRPVITIADYCAQTADAFAGSELTSAARTCGVTEYGSAVLLSGAYESEAGISGRLLDALPGVLVIPDADCHRPTVDLVAREILQDTPGQQPVLDRLLDLMLISTLRSWFDRPQQHAPVWCRTMDDSIVGRTLRLLHEHPAHPWTVADLAAKSGVSRAALARRFTAQVGEPPMTYLANRRIALAADLLRICGHGLRSSGRVRGRRHPVGQLTPTSSETLRATLSLSVTAATIARN